MPRNPCKTRCGALAPHTTLLCLGLLYGGSLVFVTPPFLAPDEQVHFYRAYQISEGTLVAEKEGARSGGPLPASLEDTAKQFLRVRRRAGRRIALATVPDVFAVPLESSNRRFLAFETTAVYSPVPYLPQAVGIRIGRAFDLGPLGLLYLGRAANVVVSVLLLFGALRAIPIFHWVIVLLALMPMAAFQMASVSADAFTHSVAFLFIALILRLALIDGAVHRRDVAGLVLVSLLLSLSKQAYFPLLLLYLAIPPVRLGSRRRYFLVFALMLAVSATALGGWALIASAVYAPPSWLSNVDPMEQLHSIAAEPIRFAGLLLGTLWKQAGDMADLLVGSRLGSLDAPLPQLLILGYQAVLIVAALCDSSPKHRVGARIKLAVLLLAAGEFLVICTFSYLSGTRVGAEHIAGLQGRYFIPISPLLLLILYNQKTRNQLLAMSPPRIPLGTIAVLGTVAFLLVSFVVTFHSLVTRYYA